MIGKTNNINYTMVEVLVEHDYIAKEPNELTITKGDIIKDVIKKQGGWWEGILKDKKGLFPDNFVRVIDKDPSVILRNRKDATRIRQCRVVYSYKQDHEDELNLNVGDVVEILGEEEEGWWRGILNGREGVFPSNFVEEIVAKNKSNSKENLTNISLNDTSPSLPAKPTKILCEVKYQYKAQNDDELSLKEGDIITLISKDGQDPGWWKGELDGVIGVFPDNFVTVLPAIEDKNFKEERRPKTHTDPIAIKPSTINQQRRSLDLLSNKIEHEIASTKTTPPVPGKKPMIPIKKSPSGSSSSGLFQGLKKKIVDVVDGATGSKNISPPKTEMSSESTKDENAFDDVVRRPLLSDVRASRPKAPGRRLPSVVCKDSEPGIINGNTDPNVMESLSGQLSNVCSSPEIDATDSKPKLREWEKHKAPWLEEMKLNQAKRTSTSPGPESKSKLTPTDKSNENEESKLSRSFEKEPSPGEISKSGLNQIKTSPSDAQIFKAKHLVPTPVGPQTIQSINNLTDTHLQKPISAYPKVSPSSSKAPSQPKSAPTPVEKNIDLAAGGDQVEEIPNKQYLELVQRINKLEDALEKQRQNYEAAIEEIRGKLQIETEMRMELQAKFENYVAEDTIQQL